MSRIDAQEVRAIARLARLELSEEEVTRLAENLQNILAYVDTLAEVDVADVEPFINAAAGSNVLRADEPRPGLPRETALENAPRQAGGFFKVPPVHG